MTIRLNKVTRDLNVGITTVVEFLQKKGYEIEASPNAKITEEQYAVLVKEFSTDKNLKIESEKFIQERQNKERNKPTVSIPEPKKEEVVKTVIPDESLPKFKPVGKIDLDNLNKRPAAPKAVEPVQVVEEKKPEPKKEQPAPAVEKPQPAPVKPVEEPKVKEAVEAEEGVFKIRSAEFKSTINVVGQIDLAALNQSTRPKKKSKDSCSTACGIFPD